MDQNKPETPFAIPDKIYGREKETQELLESYYWATTGNTEFVVLTGTAGVGKTALIKDLQKSLKNEIVFISGKFESLAQNDPYYAFLGAFQGFINNIIDLPAAEREAWKEKILKNLGSNISIFSDYLPELKILCGDQIPSVELGSTEARNRLNNAFFEFLNTIYTEKQALVVFLDDLQWVDSASLQLLNFLLVDSKCKNLLLIVAYRDNEIEPGHPLLKTLKDIEENTNVLKHINLEPLTIQASKNLIRDTLGEESKNLVELTYLLNAKTQGNPFFLKQILQLLYLQGYFKYNPEKNSWNWDLEEIRKVRFSENIIELLTDQIEKVKEPARGLIKICACLGSSFDTKKISLINGETLTENNNIIWEAVRKGFIVPFGKIFEGEKVNFINYFPTANENIYYKFLHDRVQQAAHDLLSDDERRKIHLQIGKKLVEGFTGTEHRIFDIVKHYNLAEPIITDPVERQNVAKLNLIAGKKAKDSTAYHDAINFLDTGIGFLGKDIWATDHYLALDLNKELAESKYLKGNHEEADKLFELVLSHTQESLRKAKIYNSQIDLYQSMGRFEEAIDIGVKALRLFGYDLPMENEQEIIGREVAEVQEKLKDKDIKTLLDLALMEDLEQKVVMETLLNLYAPIYNAKPQLLPFLTMKMVNITLTYGNTEASVYAYIYYGVTMGSVFHNFNAGYEFGKLALELNEKLNTVRLSCKILQIFGTMINPWIHNIQSDFPYLDQAYAAGVKCGDLIYSGFALGVKIYQRIIKGDNLDEILDESRGYAIIYKRTKDELMGSTLKACQQLIINLKGETENFQSFNSEGFSEKEFEKDLAEKKFFYSLNWFYLTKLQSSFIYNNYEEALRYSEKLKDMIFNVHFAQISIVEYSFYNGLTLTALYEKDENLKLSRLESIKSISNTLKSFSDNSPENFLHKYLLINAEIARITNKDFDATLALYDEALNDAHKNGFIQNEGIASELASKYCLKKDKNKAKTYFERAKNAYTKWGANGKVKQLKEQSLFINYK